MLDELRAASGTLSAALDQYLNICSSIRQRYSKGVNGVSQSITDLIVNELFLINAYKTRFQQASADIGAARNSVATIAPINALPEEVLSCIFYLVTYGQPCKFHNTYQYHAYPTLLTQVCSCWRYVSINSPTLWSHIDISSHGFRGSGEPHERHLAHAKSYVARAGRAYLDVHIVEDFPYGLSVDDFSLVNFLDPLANRIRSLEIHIQLSDDDHSDAHLRGDDLCNDIMSRCLVGCTPNVLKHLAIILRGENAYFLQPQDDPDASDDTRPPGSPLQLIIQKQEFESFFSPITNLKLSGRYPRWSSKAYHGLTELRLYRPWHSPVISIPNSQLAAILASSPELDTLEFGLEILGSASRPSPVALKNLRTLIMDTNSAGAFLSLISAHSLELPLSFIRPRTVIQWWSTLVMIL